MLLVWFSAWDVFVKSIYVGNLSSDVTEEDIRQVFCRYGEVSSVNIARDLKTGRSRGFAFVAMPNDEEARLAIKNVKLTSIAWRNVIVNLARPRRDRPQRGERGRWRWP